jgi:hypothetical protein
MEWGMLVDERSLLILAVVISMLSLLTNLVELSIMMTIRPIVQRLVETLSGLQTAANSTQLVNSELLKAVAILIDRTSRPNE